MMGCDVMMQVQAIALGDALLCAGATQNFHVANDRTDDGLRPCCPGMILLLLRPWAIPYAM
jgi:hypothetical protein